MARTPQGESSSTLWKGLITNADAHDVGAGAAVVQSNLEIKAAGKLAVRKGIRPGGFANPAPPLKFPVIVAAYYQRPEADWIVYQLENGDIKTGRSFA